MRILIVAEKSNSVVQTFAKSLAQQKQDVILLSSTPLDYNEIPSFTILTPFRKWSWTEGVRFIPRLLQINPDIVHFFFAEADARPRPAHWVLSSFIAGLPHKTLAASFFVDGTLRTFRDRAFLRLFDISTFGTRSQLMRIKRQKLLSRHALAEVLPPLDIEVSGESSQIRGELENLIQALGPFVLVPDPVPTKLNTRLVREYGFEILSLSDQFRSRSNYYSTGPLSPSEKEWVFQQAQALILAESDLSVLELRRYREWCERTNLPVLITPYQNELLPGLCRDSKSGWILDQGLGDLERIFDLHPSLKLEVDSGDYGGYRGHQLMDNTLNELLRLYQKAFLTRWT